MPWRIQQFLPVERFIFNQYRRPLSYSPRSLPGDRPWPLNLSTHPVQSLDPALMHDSKPKTGLRPPKSLVARRMPAQDPTTESSGYFSVDMIYMYLLSTVLYAFE